MTYGELKAEMTLRLKVDGAAMHDYDTWDTPATAALLRYIDEFMLKSKYLWLDRADLTLTTGAKSQNILSSGVGDPVTIWIDDKRITRVPFGGIQQSSGEEYNSGVPRSWAFQDGRAGVIYLDRPIDATTNAGNHWVSGWGVHPTFTSTATSVSVTSLDVEYLLDWLCYRFMRPSIDDERAEIRAGDYGAESAEFIRQRQAASLAGEMNDASYW